MRRRELLVEERLSLLALRDAAVHATGWEREGVRGWMFYEEVENAVLLAIAEVLPRLTRWGLLERIDIRVAGSKRPRWMYRVSSSGVEEAARLGRKPARVAARDAQLEQADTLYVPVRCWLLVETLRRQREQGIGRVWFGQPGWMRSRDVQTAGHRVDTEDFAWALRNQLVERREVPNVGRPVSPAIVYRISDRAMRAHAMDAASRFYVRIRFDEPEAAPTTARVRSHPRSPGVVSGGAIQALARFPGGAGR